MKEEIKEYIELEKRQREIRKDLSIEEISMSNTPRKLAELILQNLKDDRSERR